MSEITHIERLGKDIKYNLLIHLQKKIEKEIGKLIPIDQMVIEEGHLYHEYAHDTSTTTIKKKIYDLSYEEKLIDDASSNIKLSTMYIALKE